MNQTLRHVVMFRFRESSSETDVKRISEAFLALATKIEEIQDFEWGTNLSPEGLNKGLTHCYLVSFAGEKERDAYLVHPDHLAFSQMVEAHLHDLVVVDYFAHD